MALPPWDFLEFPSLDYKRASVSRGCGCCNERRLLVLVVTSDVDGNSRRAVAALRAVADWASPENSSMAAYSLSGRLVLGSLSDGYDRRFSRMRASSSGTHESCVRQILPGSSTVSAGHLRSSAAA